ncbi:hypothetical protein [Vallitalea guaymasensis]|uniref:hypothetical protein n=1 Tax=Vallitalea guaymasensis TaxID=1185412 RepID=UPI000DE4B4EA|nr:hypothetical protein [Vallitalea guaymasensis]
MKEIEQLKLQLEKYFLYLIPSTETEDEYKARKKKCPFAYKHAYNITNIEGKVISYLGITKYGFYAEFKVIEKEKLIQIPTYHSGVEGYIENYFEYGNKFYIKVEEQLLTIRVEPIKNFIMNEGGDDIKLIGICGDKAVTTEGIIDCLKDVGEECVRYKPQYN